MWSMVRANENGEHRFLLPDLFLSCPGRLMIEPMTCQLIVFLLLLFYMFARRNVDRCILNYARNTLQTSWSHPGFSCIFSLKPLQVICMCAQNTSLHSGRQVMNAFVTRYRPLHGEDELKKHIDPWHIYCLRLSIEKPGWMVDIKLWNRCV